MRTGSIFRVDKRRVVLASIISTFQGRIDFSFFSERVTDSPGLPGTEKFPGICMGLSEHKQDNPDIRIVVQIIVYGHKQQSFH